MSKIRGRFPEVPSLSTTNLARWLAATNQLPPVLIDARAAGEFEVSHLRGAHHAETVAEVRALGVKPAQPLVVYCSVGYRSSALARQLLRSGFTNVWNLEGSLFAWANEERPVYHRTNRIHRVHPYDAKWGRWLAPTWHPDP